ncbi:Zn-ribbon domain-containing OB-fold protein [Kineobactrum salinum]|uniref:ChsH2 rubredoxin-like zinc ribbon domain-containing protein n=1 Tax=Kineobactrum salinum TaxID=2708301 RepID=A0A6C0TX95_9GAMM|nr:zinc ribbon domain-containing protein [Kineobactrum salinum]QIB64143.1 hypothetical protein G3T16_00640 [Kineobactrum salinum]
MSDSNPRHSQLAREALGREATRVVKAWLPGEPVEGWCVEGFACQRCRDCGTRQYPPRALCRACLGEALEWSRVRGSTQLLAATRLHVSMHPFFRAGAPWAVGLLCVADGLCVYAFLEDGPCSPGESLTLYQAADPVGEAVVLALRPGEDTLERAAALAARLTCKKSMV